MNRFAHLIVVALLFIFSGFSGPDLHARDAWSRVQRVVAIGDVHGDHLQMIKVLAATGVIDQQGHWTGGKTHLVQTGDVPDRGPDTAKILRYFMVLEKQARRAGGFVHLLIGNHEAMNVSGDLRYVSAGEYAAFAGVKSAQLREDYFSASQKWMTANVAAELLPVFDSIYKKQWNQRYPLGYVEHRRAWAANGEFGRWVKKHNAVIRINDVLFMHGGLGPAFVGQSIKQLNKGVRAALFSAVDPVDETPSILVHTEGPLWYRGLATNPEPSEITHLDLLLKQHGVKHIVLGHTVTQGMITPRFGGKVILIDAGMSAHYGGREAALMIDNGNYSVNHRGQSMALPFTGEALSAYLDATREE